MNYRDFKVTESSVIGRYENLDLHGFFDHREYGLEVWKLEYVLNGTPIGQVLVKVSHKLATTEVSDIFIKQAPEWKKKADRITAKTQRAIRIIRPPVLVGAR